MRAWQGVLRLTRSVHIYLTMFAMLLMLFFAATGFLLNHEEWLTGGETPPVPVTDTIPAAMLGQAPDSLRIAAYLRGRYGAPNMVSTWDADSATVRIEMNGPGRHLEAEIDRATGIGSVTMERRPALVLLDDLHRGKDSGGAWRLVIDLSALLLVLAAASGIVLWIALPKRRTLGLIALGTGIGMVVAIYLLLVP